jgi:cardiolipin synthase
VSKRVRRALIILLISGCVVAVLLAFAQDQETLQLRSAVAAGDPQSGSYLSALSGAPASYGNRFDVFDNGDQAYPAMLAAIDAAKERVSFETFMVEPGEAADRFFDSFIRAATRGATVNIILDYFGSSAVPQDALERLRAAGCHVSRYNGARWFGLEEVNYRTHRKILVVDGAIAFTGGMGVADHWLGHAQDPEHWRDMQVRIDGPTARLMEAAFYENFIEERAPVTPILSPAPRASAADPGGGAAGGTPGGSAGPPVEAGGVSLIVRSSASGGSSDMKRMYLLLIASARRTLDIASPYFVIDESSAWALDDAVRRGVHVRILTEGEHTDAMPVKYASRRTYERLLSNGIELYEYQPTMFHSKVLIVDGVWTMFGSANFDNRSLELNDELNVAVHDRDLASRFLRMFEADLQRARRLELRTWQRRPLIEKAREQFWGYFGEVF